MVFQSPAIVNISNHDSTYQERFVLVPLRKTLFCCHHMYITYAQFIIYA